MNKNYRQTLLGFICVGLLAVAPQVQAQNVEKLLAEIRDYTKETVATLNRMSADAKAFVQMIVDALVEPTPEIDGTTKGNTKISTGFETAIKDYHAPFMKTAIETILTTNAANEGVHLTETTSFPGPDFPDFSSYKLGFAQINLPNNSEFSPFNIDTLMQEVAFKEGSKENNCQYQFEKITGSKRPKPLCQSYAAQGVITYLSALASPPVVPAFSKMVTPTYSQTTIDDFRKDPKVKAYLANLRSYAAAQSVGLSNLYHLYAERVIQPGLGEKLGIHEYSTVDKEGKVTPGKPIPDVSPLQAEEYLAKRRVDDPAWYKQMEETTSPMAISRETLYLLAEIRLELYKNRLETERLLATLSTLQLGSLRTEKTLLEQQGSAIVFPATAQASRATP